ncbi:MAG: Dioxygenase, ferredoxin subunit [Dehalococcoidia bacterium]|nr:Dioxygenase, ferredoxin subunit [Dehalococcoidia bacterium]
MTESVNVGRTGDIEQGAMKLVEVGERKLAIVNVGGKFYAIDNLCSHRGGPLSEGTLEGDVVECPWHGSKFNVATGERLDGPAQGGVQSFTLRVEGADLIVEIP